jgi:hypothetical protein
MECAQVEWAMLAILVHGGAGHWAPEDRVLAVAGVSGGGPVGG